MEDRIAMLPPHRIRRFVATAAIAACLVCTALGCSTPESFSFVAAADMRMFTPPKYPGSDYFGGVCEALREIGPGDFMVSPGDFDPPWRVRATLDETLGKGYAWYPVVGNHELDDPKYMAYLRAYNRNGDTLPDIVRSGPPGAVETCYAFDHGNAHFVVLNEYYDGKSDVALKGDVEDALYEWLAAELAENDKPLVFVFGHEPAVSAPDIDNGRVRHSGSSLNAYPENNHRFWTLLRKHGVLAYFCGHTHNVSVCKINGVWQLDCGHARGLGDPGAASSFLKLHVACDGVRCEVYRRNPADGAYRRTYTEKLK